VKLAYLIIFKKNDSESIFNIFFLCIVSQVLLTMHFESKMIHGKQGFINLMVYESLIRTQGE